MNKELFESLDRISDKMFEIDVKITSINEKLDELIAALHAYDDELIMDEPQHGACSKHDEASWDEIEANKRMDVIGQNGNEGTHYVSNEEADEDAEFSDYGMRIAKKVIADQRESWMDEYKPEYDKLLKSGMFFEFHPTWTGEWHKDKFAFTHEHKFSNKGKVGDKDKSNNAQPKQKRYYKNNGSKRNENKK